LLILFKLEFVIFKWHIDNKKQSDYKRRVVICYTLCTAIPLKDFPIWFFDEYFQFLIWNTKHLGCLSPYTRSTVSTAMNEGPCAQDLLRYSTQNKNFFGFNPELLEAFFFLAFTQENKVSRYYIIKKFLEAIQYKYNDVLLSREIFWIVSRLKCRFFPTTSIEEFLGQHFIDFLVRLILYDLHKDVNSNLTSED
jgi:hypothetical protein